MTKLFEAQTALFNKLENDDDLNQVITGVFDSVPEEPFPYIVLGRVYTRPHKTKTTDGEIIEFTLDVWSGSNGKKETINIVNCMEKALLADLDVDGAFVVSQEVKSVEILEEVNDLYHGTFVFEIILDLE